MNYTVQNNTEIQMLKQRVTALLAFVQETRNPQPLSAQTYSFFHSLIRPKPEKTPNEFAKMDYKQSTSEWGICMRNVTARHRYGSEKRINARHSLSGARLISRLPNSRVHTCPRYAPFIHMHLLARRHSMSSNPLMQSGFKQP